MSNQKSRGGEAPERGVVIVRKSPYFSLTEITRGPPVAVRTPPQVKLADPDRAWNPQVALPLP